MSWTVSYFLGQCIRGPWWDGNQSPLRLAVTMLPSLLLSTAHVTAAVAARRPTGPACKLNWPRTNWPVGIPVRSPPDSWERPHEWLINGKAYCILWPLHRIHCLPSKPNPYLCFLHPLMSLNAYFLEGHNTTHCSSGKLARTRRHALLGLDQTLLRAVLKKKITAEFFSKLNSTRKPPNLKKIRQFFWNGSWGALAAPDLPAPEAPPQTSGFTEQEMETPV